MKWIKALCELNDKKIKCIEKWAKCKKYCQIVDARKIHIWPLSLWYPTTGTLYRRTTQVIGFRKSMEWKNTCLHLPIGYSHICWTSHFDKNIRLFVTPIKTLCLISIYFVMTATQKYDSSAPIVGLNLSSPCMSKLHMAEADALIQDGQNMPSCRKAGNVCRFFLSDARGTWTNEVWTNGIWLNRNLGENQKSNWGEKNKNLSLPRCVSYKFFSAQPLPSKQNGCTLSTSKHANIL